MEGNESNSKVSEALEASDDILATINRLLPQLGDHSQTLTMPEFKNLIADDDTKLLIAYDGAHKPVGMATVILFNKPNGRRAILEDVVVDESARGLGLGRALVEKAIAVATEAGARWLQLTSRPSRVAANKLYQSAGFNLHETNVYQISLN